ncbi:hypothetical protein NLJ89_g5792 [Agrocybe chaxingu]|uniref:CBM1 domain-containing protein n=1 Tax=Agrocybe chaxingu TaxID=84603 RepID=A0A9W8K0F0_9AGAR|nr:hypothetical protein NLJ89_g5792 [Agrocybe chaxingu]
MLSLDSALAAPALTSPPPVPTVSTSTKASEGSCSTITTVYPPPPRATTEVVQPWNQCGGKGYTGPTTCVSHATCKMYTETHWYCVPDPVTVTYTFCS